MKAKLLLLIVLALGSIASAQTVDKQKVSEFATAVARAEGFGVKHALPTRNHNPGDIKSGCHYIHFRNDAEGWAALRAQIAKLAAGESKHYTLTMTINQVSKIYAGDYRWGKIVAKTLGVEPTTKLRDFFAAAPEPEAPVVSLTTSLVTLNLPAPPIVVPVLAEN